jgi:GH18 family chitinase
MLSKGEWIGIGFFSTVIGNAQNRTKFVATIRDLAMDCHLDGVDFEYVRLV